MKNKKMLILFVVVIILLLVSYFSLKDKSIEGEKHKGVANAHAENTDSFYLSLLSKFPEERQGYGLDTTYENGKSDQPETYGLVLSAESLRYKEDPSEEGERRIKKATKWLLDNKDADKDNIPGWGLPQAWDAFADGTENPSNQSYTISNALIFEGLLDALSIETFWSEDEKKEIQKVLLEISLYYSEHAWSDDKNGGYFWYSTNENDAYFTPNVSSAFLGVLARFVSEHPDVFTEKQRDFIINKADRAANSIAHEVQLDSGAPYWFYVTVPNKLNHERPNDLVHHTYIIWGMEMYRHYLNNIEIPWSLQQSKYSLDNFWKEGKLYDFPQYTVYKGELESLNERPAVLWGSAMMSVFYGRWSEKDKADKAIDYIQEEYGNWPDLHLWPTWFSKDEKFYTRYTSHVLWGLAYNEYYD